MQLKDLLEELTEKYNVQAFIDTDPVQFPRRFSRLQDVEVSALLTSVITWGRRDMVRRDAQRLHEAMGDSPFDFIIEGGWQRWEDSARNVHRTIFERDLFFVCRALQGFYATHHSLEELFTGRNGVLGGLHELSVLLQTRHVASPLTQSPCKRSNLMLRWLVRNDGIVDLGVWQRISPAELIIPLDVHVGRISRELWTDIPRTERLKTALIITDHLKEFCPHDPCKYDFALFGFGEEQSRMKLASISPTDPEKTL